MEKYDLLDLIEILQDHSIQIDQKIEENKEKFPDAEWTKDQFNISKALFIMCCEIQDLKNGQNTR